MSAVALHDATRCALGEGPLWHPGRGALYWCDILGKRVHGPEGPWDWGEHVSAMGWIDEASLLVASETALWRLDIARGERERLADLESDNPVTRSNDGRADPFGGFWIGTMGKRAETGAGAIWRYYRGELRKLVGGITITNAICFAPDGGNAFWVDTKDGRIMRQPIDGTDGWPTGPAELFLDLSGEDFGADGAVVDAAGNLWNAQWGAGRVACYSPEGELLETIAFPARQTSCPAFGGPDLSTLFVTSAADGLGPDDSYPSNGCTFCVPTGHTGQAEHRVIL